MLRELMPDCAIISVPARESDSLTIFVGNCKAAISATGGGARFVIHRLSTDELVGQGKFNTVANAVMGALEVLCRLAREEKSIKRAA